MCTQNRFLSIEISKLYGTWTHKVEPSILSTIFSDIHSSLVKAPCPTTFITSRYTAFGLISITSSLIMVTSSNWNIFGVTGPFCGEIHRSPVSSPQRVVFSLICTWINGWVNNHETGDLKRPRAHYDVTVMSWAHIDLGRFHVRYFITYLQKWSSHS